LIDDLLQAARVDQVDYTVFFRACAPSAEIRRRNVSAVGAVPDPSAFRRLPSLAHTATARSSCARSASAQYASCQPAFIPRNHRIEQAISRRRERQFRPSRPRKRARAHYEEQPITRTCRAALVGERVSATFCRNLKRRSGVAVPRRSRNSGDQYRCSPMARIDTCSSLRPRAWHPARNSFGTRPRVVELMKVSK